MPDLYTDDDAQAAVHAITVARGLDPAVANSYRDAMQGDWARAVLDAIAPTIAARALREAAAAIEDTPWEVASQEGPLADADDRTWLHGTDCGIRFASRLTLMRADEIEAGR